MSAALPFGVYDAEYRVVDRPSGKAPYVRLDRCTNGEWSTEALFPADHVPQIIAALQRALRNAPELTDTPEGVLPSKEPTWVC